MRFLAFVAGIVAVAAIQGCADSVLPKSVVAPGRFTQVSAGGGHACAVDTLSRAWCWGSNGKGAVGIGVNQCPSLVSSLFPGCVIAPAPLNTSLRFTQVSVGRNHSCGITTTGAAYCWGSNAAGQLGTTAGLTTCDGISCATAPAIVGGGHSWSSISAGVATTCAVTTAGVGKCWGELLGPIQGTGTASSAQLPTTVRVGGAGDSIWVSFARPMETTACGTTTAQRPVCWGDGSFGQLGVAQPLSARQAPAMIGGSAALSSVTMGSYFGCALEAGKTAVCWGGTDGSSNTCSVTAVPVTCATLPAAVGGAYMYSSLSAGSYHVCGVLSDRPETRCWGSDLDYAVGLGASPFAVTVPYPVGGAHPFTTVSTGERFACALTGDRNIWCWGTNRAGQLGTHPLDGRQSFNTLVYSAQPLPIAATITQGGN